MKMKSLRLQNPLKSVGLKLFIIIFSAILLCVLIVGLSSYSTARTIIQNKVAESTSVALQQSKGKLDLMFKNYEELSMQILIDRSIQSDLLVIARSKEDYAKFEASSKINEALQKYAIGNQSIANVALIPVKEGGQSLSTGYEIKEARKADWFKQVIELDGKAMWFPVSKSGLNDSGTNPTFALSRLIKSTSSNEARYVLVIEVQMKQLAGQLEDLKLGEEGGVAIVDGNNNYVYHTDVELLGTASGVGLPAINDKKSQDRGSIEATDAAGNEVLAVYNKFQSMDWRLLGTLPVKELVKDAGQISQMTWIIAGLAALLAIGIGWFVVWMVATPLSKLRNLMNEGAQGNLTVRSTFKSKDEIGQLADSFNQMMTQITVLVNQTNQTARDVLMTAGELTEASKKTAVAAKEIAIATEEIASGAMSLAVEAEKGSDLTGEISSQMKQVMEANGQMVASADEVEKSSHQGTAYMSMLIEKTGLTEEMVRSMVEKVDRLKESTRSIRKILEVLNNMTKQTNILSLNATIEAARAGTAGKGFMVVADEIRKLADQSRQSIEVVGQITVTIQKEIDETVDVLSNAYPLFREQISSVKEANEIFLSVQEQMAQFTERLGGATDAVVNLGRSQTVLSETMSSVSAVAEESSATSEEVASLSSEQTNISQGLVQLSDKLERVSKELSELLAKFRT
ncbi:methyl-accepting chemotaxis protein [Paenibacillus sp. GCM10027626]|uniref:methyl-accepting chemotaxis protein n=1 Tax=Paenibacillus sp. GCM10027626 TaxID=3273411 RepID=UPI00362F683E